MSWPDYLVGGSVDYKFSTLAVAGTVATMSGGSVVVYKNNGTVESSAGVTLTADFDARTGLNHVGINLAADGSFYAAGGNFQVVLAAGTANSVSLNNYVLFHFTVEAQNQKPTGGTVANVSGSVTGGVAFAGSVVGNVGGSVFGGVLSAGTVTNPILIRGGTCGTITSPIPSIAPAGIASMFETVVNGDYTAGMWGDYITNPYVTGGTIHLAQASGTITSPILVRGGTVAEVTALSAGAYGSVAGSVLANPLAATQGWGTVTVADALQASWSDAYGIGSVAGTVYTLFTPDNTNTARRFGLDNSGTPHVRTPF